MHNPYEIPIAPTTLMCVDCKGVGTLGGSMYATESCTVCKGTGMVQKGSEDEMKINDYTYQEKQTALDEAHVIMNPVEETDAEREWLMNCKQFANADDIKKLVEKVNEYKSKLRYMTHHRDELAEQVRIKHNGFIASMAESVELAQENEQLREALEFYADIENNLYIADYPDSYLTESKVMEDDGDIARKALEVERCD